MNTSVRQKNIAAFFALFLGSVGVHKFYLGKIGQGVLYAIFSWTFLPMLIGFIDFLVLMLMDQEDFDRKYNNEVPFRTPVASYKRQTVVVNSKKVIYKKEEVKKSYPKAKSAAPNTAARRPIKVNLAQNKTYLEALDFFNNYRYREAKVKLMQVLAEFPLEAEVYFRLACCNSLLEEKKDLFVNLELAFQHGFKNIERIKTSDALAYLRIQKEYDALLASEFKVWPQISEDGAESIAENHETFKVEETVTTEPEGVELSTDELLEQLKKLGELRQSGVLTEEEFLREKQKLFA